MNKEQVNKLLKLKGVICENDDEYADEFRRTYYTIIGELKEEDFYYSMLAWFFDGNAPYYESYLIKYWK